MAFGDQNLNDEALTSNNADRSRYETVPICNIAVLNSNTGVPICVIAVVSLKRLSSDLYH